MKYEEKNKRKKKAKTCIIKLCIKYNLYVIVSAIHKYKTIFFNMYKLIS